MRVKGHTPVRTCISCGVKYPKNELIKLIVNGENRLIRDNSGRIKGRGAYVCELRPCLERLFDNKRLNRHFRTEGNIYVSKELNDVLPFDGKITIKEI